MEIVAVARVVSTGTIGTNIVKRALTYLLIALI